MLDIKEVYPEFQKLQKTDNCIVIVLKTENKIAITSPVSTWVLGLVVASIFCRKLMHIEL